VRPYGQVPRHAVQSAQGQTYSSGTRIFHAAVDKGREGEEEEEEEDVRARPRCSARGRECPNKMMALERLLGQESSQVRGRWDVVR
jgi:hypothetical protein